ncbi:MAG: hypothetical protein JNK61_03385 [Bacteroidia bacterium]|nr:hypothetical protein [Bacteroidia bacterium]HQV00759.1 hypothetical protein [Bacteroidia bacterium]
MKNLTTVFLLLLIAFFQPKAHSVTFMLTPSYAVPPAELPLSRANHLIDPVEGRAIVNKYHQGGQGAFYTSATLNKIISQKNASGIRGYYAYHNDRMTILIVGATRQTETRHNDILPGIVALQTGTTVVSPEQNQQVDTGTADTAAFNYRHSAHYNDKIKGGLFGKDAIVALLDQPGCVGVRFYIGLNSSGKKTMVLFGVDAKGVDLVAYVADQNVPCPNYCSDSNSLNTDKR